MRTSTYLLWGNTIQPITETKRSCQRNELVWTVSEESHSRWQCQVWLLGQSRRGNDPFQGAGGDNSSRERWHGEIADSKHREVFLEFAVKGREDRKLLKQDVGSREGFVVV